MNDMTATRVKRGRAARWIAAVTMALVAALIAAVPAAALQVQDVVRIKGSEQNKLVGMGLVVGLAGTGDGGKYLPAMRALARMINVMNDPNAIAAELRDAENVALVSITATLPAVGVREGDVVDVQVASIGPAESLAGGRLFMTPLTLMRRDSPIFAYAEGPVTIEDEDTPTVGRVAGGAQLVADVMTRLIADGRITLVIDEAKASWPTASYIATQINAISAPDRPDDVPDIARAIDQRNIVIDVPMWQREDLASFMSEILRAPLSPEFLNTEAKVVINERTGSIVMSGDVRISPVMISHAGLVITTLNPAPPPNPAEPRPIESHFVAMDPEGRGESAPPGERLSDLVAAFNQLKVPAQDRIEIIKLMHRAGELHAKLIVE